MTKRYQVFVSSTFVDLQDERREIMQALLELRCIPSGMELFPAANEEQWKLIRRVIDDSDYYVVVIGGRYGSVDADGISYTEKEYRYALEKGIPVLGFVHCAPDSIASSKTEKTAAGRKRLEQFRKLVESKHVKYWSDAKDLGGKVSRAIANIVVDEPAIGWVRGSEAISEDQAREVLALQKRVRELDAKLEKANIEPPPGVENLAQGDDIHIVPVILWDDLSSRREKYDWRRRQANVSITWNEVLTAIAPFLLAHASKASWIDALETALKKAVTDGRCDHHADDNCSVEITEKALSQIIIQLRVVGLVRPKGASGSFSLTEYGERLTLQLNAIQSIDASKEHLKAPVPVDIADW